MLPVGPLMIEHRLIERLIGLWQAALPALSKCDSIDPAFWDPGVDFMEVYADRCHHGKEEAILFDRLKQKNISPQLARVLSELINEHQIARDALKGAVAAKARCARPDPSAPQDFYRNVKVICDLYPAHIEKEDKHFFLPCMEYFSAEEKQKMLDDFDSFDRGLIHEKYKNLLSGLEEKTGKGKKASAKGKRT